MATGEQHATIASIRQRAHVRCGGDRVELLKSSANHSAAVLDSLLDVHAREPRWEVLKEWDDLQDVPSREQQRLRKVAQCLGYLGHLALGIVNCSVDAIHRRQ